MITLALTGDVMLGRGVSEAVDRRLVRPEELWGDVMPLLDSADLRIINLECPLTDYEQRWTRTPKRPHFRAPPSAIETLLAARIDACSLANNHTVDFEERGLLDTIEHLDAAGIRHAGAGRDQKKPPHLASFPCRGSVGSGLGFWPSRTICRLSRRDTGPDELLPVSSEPEVLRQVEGAVSSLRVMGADTIIFSNHWGPNWVLRPKWIFRRFARAVIDRGVDVYYGTARTSSRGWRRTAADRASRGCTSTPWKTCALCPRNRRLHPVYDGAGEPAEDPLWPQHPVRTPWLERT